MGDVVSFPGAGIPPAPALPRGEAVTQMTILDWSKRGDVTVVDLHHAGTCITCGKKCLIKVAGVFQHKVCAERLIDEASA